MHSAIRRLSGGLIVSCQAPDGSPLRSPEAMAMMARAAELGGAVGIRANGVEDIRAIRDATSLPIIGLHKVMGQERLIITPTPELAMALVDAGADVVASDATTEVAGVGLRGLRAVLSAIDVPLMADVSTWEEGVQASELGAEIIGTTLSGYSRHTRAAAGPGPDIELVHRLASSGMRVFAEGRVRTPEEARDAIKAGATSVVVGGAITNPVETSMRFASVWDAL